MLYCSALPRARYEFLAHLGILDDHGTLRKMFKLYVPRHPSKGALAWQCDNLETFLRISHYTLMSRPRMVHTVTCVLTAIEPPPECKGGWMRGKGISVDDLVTLLAAAQARKRDNPELRAAMAKSIDECRQWLRIDESLCEPTTVMVLPSKDCTVSEANMPTIFGDTPQLLRERAGPCEIWIACGDQGLYW
eukprot:gene9902-54836_t